MFSKLKQWYLQQAFQYEEKNGLPVFKQSAWARWNILSGWSINLAIRRNKALAEEGFTGRRLHLKAAMTAVHAYEFELSCTLIDTIKAVPHTSMA